MASSQQETVRLQDKPESATRARRYRLVVVNESGSSSHALPATGQVVLGRGDDATLRLDERLYTDTWGLWALTTDARVMIDLGRRWLVWPHLRAHTQSSASFWQRAYEAVAAPDGNLAPPRYRTGDRELSRLDTFTGGFGAKVRVSSSVHAPWHLSYQLDAAYTQFHDALYITQRWSLFSALGVTGQWN